MKKKFLIGGAIVACFLAAALASPPGRLLLWAVFTDPATVSWDSKSAYARCPSAIAGYSDWPREKDKACAAMSLCVDEGALSSKEMMNLQSLMRSQGCQPL